MQSIKVTSSALLLAALMVCCMQQMASAAYNVGYGVNDPGTGDIKDQQETKNGDQLTGYYRLLDADGLVRTVNYQSNPSTGFTAQVNRDPIGLEGQAKYRSAEAAQQARMSWPSNPHASLVPAIPRTPLVPTNQYVRYDDGPMYVPVEGYQQW